jgi:hypothetical protein
MVNYIFIRVTHHKSSYGHTVNNCMVPRCLRANVSTLLRPSVAWKFNKIVGGGHGIFGKNDVGIQWYIIVITVVARVIPVISTNKSPHKNGSCF